MKTQTTEQMHNKAARLVRDLHGFYLQHVEYVGGELGAQDLALINAIVNAETHIAAHYPESVQPKKSKHG